MINALQTLRDRLAELESQAGGGTYRVPALWVNPVLSEGDRVVTVEPVNFFRASIDAILALDGEEPEMQASAGDWTKDAVVYNIFTRLTTAWGS